MKKALSSHAGNEDLVDVVKDGNLVAMLLDMCELALHQVFAPGAAQDSIPDLAGCDQLWAALTALVAVLALHQAAPPMSQDLCCDLMLLFTDIAQVRSSCMRPLGSTPVCMSHLLLITDAACQHDVGTHGLSVSEAIACALWATYSSAKGMQLLPQSSSPCLHNLPFLNPTVPL